MRKFLLWGIIFVAFVLRIWNLTRFPVGFTPDEASFGYDAYSILKTGADQWGHKFPLVLESFGDFKSPLYAYLTIPSIAIFDLTKFAVRLPNAILGILSVFIMYLLAKKIAGSERVGAVAAALLAISPWHIMMSRGAFEANLITFFLPLGIYLFLTKRYSLSALVFGLNLFTYHSAKLITPVVFIALLIIFRKEMKKFFLPAVSFSVFFTVMIYTFYIGGGARISERSITEGALEAGAKVKIELIQKGANPILARLAHNKYQVVLGRFINNYFQYFSPRFLFTKGPAETTYGMIPNVGVLTGLEVLLLLGLIPFFFRSEKKGLIFLLLGWLLITPIPAALATGVGYSANRVEAMLPVLEILAAFGALEWIRILKNNKIFLTIASFFLAYLISWTLVRFQELYFKDSPKIAAKGMLYGNLEAAEWLRDNKGGKKVVVSRSLSEPHIYIAFADRWDPADYQEATKSWDYKDQGVSWVDQMGSYTLGNGEYVFQSVDWKKNTGKPNTLLVGRPQEFLDNVIPAKIVYYPDGQAAIYVVDSDANQNYAKVN